MADTYTPNAIAIRTVPGAIPGGVAAVEACLRALERVEQVVDQETEALRREKSADLQDFLHKKSHGLLELSRAMRGLDPAALRNVQPRLETLREALKRNLAVLKMHLDAVGEISTIIAGALREAESDGTYSLRQHAGGNGP